MVGIVVDRDTYPGNIVKVTTYMNGVRDGDPTLINFKGARLQGMANLTVGFGRVGLIIMNEIILNNILL